MHRGIAIVRALNAPHCGLCRATHENPAGLRRQGFDSHHHPADYQPAVLAAAGAAAALWCL